MTRSKSVSQIVRDDIKKEFKIRFIGAPTVQPTCTTELKFNMMLLFSKPLKGTLAKADTYEVEIKDIMKNIWKLGGFPDAEATAKKTIIWPQKAFVYMQTENAADTNGTPLFKLWAFDPITGQVDGSCAVQGTTTQPAKKGVAYPPQISERPFGWEWGKTSASLVGMSSKDTGLASIYIKCVCSISSSNDDPVYIRAIMEASKEAKRKFRALSRQASGSSDSGSRYDPSE